MEKINKEDLIRRSDAIESVCKVSCGGGYCGIPCDEVKAIKQLPSSEPERPKGQWEKMGVTPVRYTSIEEVQVMRCNECKGWLTTQYMYYPTKYNFCPNCGADMRKGEEQE